MSVNTASPASPKASRRRAATPIRAANTGRDALVAVAMNGTPLPVAHGFPARLGWNAASGRTWPRDPGAAGPARTPSSNSRSGHAYAPGRPTVPCAGIATCFTTSRDRSAWSGSMLAVVAGRKLKVCWQWPGSFLPGRGRLRGVPDRGLLPVHRPRPPSSLPPLRLAGRGDHLRRPRNHRDQYRRLRRRRPPRRTGRRYRAGRRRPRRRLPRACHRRVRSRAGR